MGICMRQQLQHYALPVADAPPHKLTNLSSSAQQALLAYGQLDDNGCDNNSHDSMPQGGSKTADNRYILTTLSMVITFYTFSPK